MRRVTSCGTMLCAALLFASRAAAAQRGHAWLLADAGAALAGGGDYSGNAAFFAHAGVGGSVDEVLGVELAALGYFPHNAACSNIVLGRCGRGFPQTTGITLGVIDNRQGIGSLHTSSFDAGIGVFRTGTLTGTVTTTGGLYVGGEGTLVLSTYGSIDVGGRVIALPRVSKQLLFIFPLMVGFRIF